MTPPEPESPVSVERIVGKPERCRAIGGIGFCRRRSFFRVGGSPRCPLHVEMQLSSNLRVATRHFNVHEEEAHA